MDSGNSCVAVTRIMLASSCWMLRFLTRTSSRLRRADPRSSEGLIHQTTTSVSRSSSAWTCDLMCAVRSWFWPCHLAALNLGWEGVFFAPHLRVLRVRRFHAQVFLLWSLPNWPRRHVYTAYPYFSTVEDYIQWARLRPMSYTSIYMEHSYKHALWYALTLVSWCHWISSESRSVPFLCSAWQATCIGTSCYSILVEELSSLKTHKFCVCDCLQGARRHHFVAFWESTNWVCTFPTICPTYWL